MDNLETLCTWAEFEETLQSNCNWIGIFRDSVISQAIDKVKSKTLSDYQPLLIETFLKDASSALDRCLSLQRERCELEVEAVKAEASYRLFLRLAELDAKLETNALSIERLQVEEAGYREASETFSSDEGFAKHDATLSKAAAVELSLATERQKLLDDRWAVMKQYEADYHSRHTQPGNAHNYKERSDRIVELLADDLQEAYEKLHAVRIGLMTVYEKDFPLPDLQGEETLHNLVLWTREVIRFLDIEAQYESSYEVLIPLVQPWRPSEEPIISKRDFNKIIDKEGTKKVISFDLSGVFFNQERVRLRGVGLSFGTVPASASDTTLDRMAYWRLRATIQTPKQQKLTDSGVSGGYFYRPPIVLGNVPAYGRSIPAVMQSGQECYNVDPRGQWKIVLNRHAVWADNKEETIEDTFFHKQMLYDLKLHLLVVAKAIPGTDTVFAS